MSTHLAAWASWGALCDRFKHDDPFRLVRTAPGQRRLQRSDVLQRIGHCMKRINELGQHHTLPSTPELVVKEAMDRFSRYHKTRALGESGSDIIVEDPRLCLYYKNRLDSLNWGSTS